MMDQAPGVFGLVAGFCGSGDCPITHLVWRYLAANEQWSA